MRKINWLLFLSFIALMIFWSLIIILGRSVTKLDDSSKKNIENVADKKSEEKKSDIKKQTTDNNISVKKNIINNITSENIFNAVNNERIKLGINPLQRDDKLDIIAQNKLNDILKYNYWSHINPTTGATPRYWLDKEYYNFFSTGENLAKEFNYTNEIIDAWMLSPTHKKNIVNEKYKKTGIAVDGDLVVQIFVEPIVFNYD